MILVIIVVIYPGIFKTTWSPQIRVHTGFGKSWKVMEIEKTNSRTWKCFGNFLFLKVGYGKGLKVLLVADQVLL